MTLKDDNYIWWLLIPNDGHHIAHNFSSILLTAMQTFLRMHNAKMQLWTWKQMIWLQCMLAFSEVGFYPQTEETTMI